MRVELYPAGLSSSMSLVKVLSALPHPSMLPGGGEELGGRFGCSMVPAGHLGLACSWQVMAWDMLAAALKECV